MPNEREVIAEFIELYCSLPCLWDMRSESYKDKNQKSQCWEILAEKLQELEPAANIALAKKKVEHLRTAYKREAKKIADSKSTGSGASDVHVPNLWYFNLLKPVFEDKEVSRSGVDTLTSDDEESLHNTEAKKKIPKHHVLEQKKKKLIDTAEQLLRRDEKKQNSFGVYVGEQLDEIGTSQRQIAEKLISEVLFLAKTGNLNFNTIIESTSRPSDIFSNSQSHSPEYIDIVPSLSPHYIQSSPKYIRSSPTPQFSQQTSEPTGTIYSPPQYASEPTITNIYSPPQYIITSPSPQSNHTITSSPPHHNGHQNGNKYEGPASILKEFLIVKKHK